MSNNGNKIVELLNARTAAAHDVTKPLKAIGDGNMLDGVKNIFKYGENLGFAKGEKSGFVKGGVVGIGICSALYLIPKGVNFVKTKATERKAHDEMGEKIYTAFSEEFTSEPDPRGVENEESEISEA